MHFHTSFRFNLLTNMITKLNIAYDLLQNSLHNILTAGRMYVLHLITKKYVQCFHSGFVWPHANNICIKLNESIPYSKLWICLVNYFMHRIMFQILIFNPLIYNFTKINFNNFSQMAALNVYELISIVFFLPFLLI